VLEFACADGSNLLPMACEFPNSEFVGIDLSPIQIDAAQDAVNETGIKNARFHAINLLDADEVLEGEFDYIIAHGLYSWVPEIVKKKLLEISKKYLSANGIIYISYNTLPGWRPLQAIREMMLYHTSGMEDEAQKSGQSRAFINFLANAVPEDDPYGLTLKNQVRDFTNYSDAYFMHDWLEAENEPVYFHQFVKAANQEGLQYLGDSNVPSMFATQQPEEVVQTVKSLSTDQVNFEQYLDFIRNRRFRHTLLCHEKAQVSHDLKSARLNSMYLRSSIVANDSKEANVFKTCTGGQVKVNNDAARLLLQVLVDSRPGNTSLTELKKELHKRLAATNEGEGTASPIEKDKATHFLLDAVVRGLAELSGRHFIAGSDSCDLPQSQAYARYQAKNSFAVTNRVYETKSLDPLALLLIRHLDGKTTKESLAEAVAEALKSGEIKLVEGEQAAFEGNISSEMLQELVNEGLKNLEEAMLLVS
jgi:methyltransferase-like protein